MANVYIPLLLFLIQILIFVAMSRAKVPAVIVFGDSTVDAGNNNLIPTISKSNFRPYGRDFPGGRPTGRFCNGRIPTDFISEAFGLNPTVPAYLDPMYNIFDFATGVSFASASSGFDNLTSDILHVIPLWRQMEYYKEYQKRLREYVGNDEANGIISEALYVISTGTNDFIQNYNMTTFRRSQFTLNQYEDFIVGLAGNFITDIYGLGARKIGITGLAPIGCVPSERAMTNLDGHACAEENNRLALDFNGKLKHLVVDLTKELSGLELVFTNTYDILMQLITTPSNYGFEVSRRGCCCTGTIEMGILCNLLCVSCTDANKYVF